MRSLSLALLLGASSLAWFGCEGKRSSAASPTAQADMASRVEALQKEESSVLSRKSELERERQAVKEARAALEEKKKAGGDPKALATEEEALKEREARLLAEEMKNSEEVEKLLSQYKALTASSGAGAGDVTQREASMAVREKDVAGREQGLAKREGELASRERELARREKETCSAVPTTIVQTALSPGARYTRRDVEAALGKARRKMSEKGILSGDLPPHASNLEKEATESMGSGEYGRAKLAADALLATVDQMKIDKGFIQAKINRLSSKMKAQQTSKEVEELFRGATSDYGDGRFPAANGKLNKIYALIR